jgi:hypothetical protein
MMWVAEAGRCCVQIGNANYCVGRSQVRVGESARGAGQRCVVKTLLLFVPPPIHSHTLITLNRQSSTTEQMLSFDRQFFFYGCILYNNNEMCPFDRALQVCCHPEAAGRRLLATPGAAPINATLARAPAGSTVAETVEVRITANSKGFFFFYTKSADCVVAACRS